MSTKNWIGTGAQGAAGSLRIVRNSDGFILDASNDTFTDPLSVVAEYYTPTESAANPGTYSWTLAGADWGTDTYRWYWYASAAGAGDVVVSTMTLEVDEEPVAVAPLDAAEIRAAVGLVSPDLDTQLSGIAGDAATAAANVGVDAAGVRAAIGLSEANLDTQLSWLPKIFRHVRNILVRSK